MQLVLRDQLAHVAITVGYQGQVITLSDVVLDTGSDTTILAADAVAAIGIEPERGDPLYLVTGVGGSEAVFSRRVDRLQVGNAWLDDFEIQIGAMDYGFAIDGILGMDFSAFGGCRNRPEGARVDLDRQIRLLTGHLARPLPLRELTEWL